MTLTTNAAHKAPNLVHLPAGTSQGLIDLLFQSKEAEAELISTDNAVDALRSGIKRGDPATLENKSELPTLQTAHNAAEGEIDRVADAITAFPSQSLGDVLVKLRDAACVCSDETLDQAINDFERLTGIHRHGPVIVTQADGTFGLWERANPGGDPAVRAISRWKKAKEEAKVSEGGADAGGQTSECLSRAIATWATTNEGLHSKLEVLKDLLGDQDPHSLAMQMLESVTYDAKRISVLATAPKPEVSPLGVGFAQAAE